MESFNANISHQFSVFGQKNNICEFKTQEYRLGEFYQKTELKCLFSRFLI